MVSRSPPSPAVRRTYKMVRNKYFLGAALFVTTTMVLVNIQAVLMLQQHESTSTHDLSSQLRQRLMNKSSRNKNPFNLNDLQLKYARMQREKRVSGPSNLKRKPSVPGIRKGNEITGFKTHTRRQMIRNHGPHQQLNCENYGGPSIANASEMVYWYANDDMEANEYEGQLVRNNDIQEEQFLTFEPDRAGFNNKRIALESTIAIALATGRTLVLPPKMDVHSKAAGSQSFTDFYNLGDGSSKLKIISMEDFLKRNDAGFTSLPPKNRTNWDGLDFWHQEKLYKYLRSVAVTPVWSMDKCVIALGNNQTRMDEILKRALKIPRQQRLGAPTPVYAAPYTRLRNVLADRKELCVFNETILNAKVIHLQAEPSKGIRLLSPFYAMVFVEDWKLDIYIKRFIRDHLRYTDFLHCAAARVVAEIREIARANGNPHGDFDTMHIRRGDFLIYYSRVKASAEQIYETAKADVPEKSTVFIATDERDERFFEPLRQRYHLLFLEDFQHVLGNAIMPFHQKTIWEEAMSMMGFGKHTVSGQFLGMIDQLVASRGRTFVGVYYSTFTAFINRMRGYHQQAIGKADGTTIRSFYYKPDMYRNQESSYHVVMDPPWSREWPVGYVDIDHDIQFRKNVTKPGTNLIAR